MRASQIKEGVTYKGRAWASKKRGPRRVLRILLGADYDQHVVRYDEPRIGGAPKEIRLANFAKWASGPDFGMEFKEDAG